MNWIKVSDRLPETFKDVLVYYKNANEPPITPYLNTFEPNEKYFSIDSFIKWNDDHPDSFRGERFYKSKALAWTELPEPPNDFQYGEISIPNDSDIEISLPTETPGD